MKQITNWKNATVFDLEADALLDEATKIHVLSYSMVDGRSGSIEGAAADRIKAFVTWHIDNGVPVIAHNGIGYDVPLIEKLLGIDLSKLMVIDTLALSWYLNTDRVKHGLDSFLEDYGIEKPKIDDWSNLTYEEYRHRCQEDVKINRALWEDLQARLIDIYVRVKAAVDNGLVDGTRASADEIRYIDQYKQFSGVEDYINRILTFLMYKMDCARLQESTGVQLDVGAAKALAEQLTTLTETAKKELEAVMPKVPKYAKRKRPAKPYKKNGELSASGIEWNTNTGLVGKKDEHGNVLAEYDDTHDLRVLVGYDEPNIDSSSQIKDWLFALGWKPKTFKYVKDDSAWDMWIAGGRRGTKPKDRAIPQVNKEGENGKELCDSVLELAEEVPQIKAYSGYSLLKHRLGIVEGFLENVSENGFLKARIGGFTNTLRVQHREIVNLPGVGKPWGKEIRGLLISGKGQVFQGADLASLEDRVKHDFMIPHDPAYVSQMMADDFDPHILTALAAGMISKQEFDDFMLGNKSDNAKNKRKIGKVVNYSSVYGAGPAKIALTSGMSLEEAKQAHEGYWKLNWAVTAIADEQCVITDSRGSLWLVNPVNGFAYSLRTQKDRFSTLIQGTGSYFFDIWVDKVMTKMEKKWGVKRLCMSFHDEFVTRFRDTEGNRKAVKEMTLQSIEDINKEYYLRRKLGCECQNGSTYADIH
jgi:DNA polymerase I-like protein with 3'-5' exonuclease and polymerase domains